MTFLYVLLGINYIVAIFLLWQITDNDVWAHMVRDIKSTRDLAEQAKFNNDAPLVRKIFCWALLFPGIGLVFLFMIIKNMSNR